MTDQELDQSYTAMCNALNEVGETNAQQFLSMLSLSLMARASSASEVLALIVQAQKQCHGVATTWTDYTGGKSTLSTT